MKQSISNACGTIAVLHALANNINNVEIENGSTLDKFFEATKSLFPKERDEILQQEVGIANAHRETAAGGQTKVSRNVLVR